MKIHLWIHVFLVLLCLLSISAKDYYEILGVKRDASDKEIKRRFRQLGKNKIIR